MDVWVFFPLRSAVLQLSRAVGVSQAASFCATSSEDMAAVPLFGQSVIT